jgi:hypothetical protein
MDSPRRTRTRHRPDRLGSELLLIAVAIAPLLHFAVRPPES